MRQFLRNHFEAPGGGKRILAMEGLRGAAALLVFFVHFDALFRPYFSPGSWAEAVCATAGSFGHTGVDLFFVLSGFLIYSIVIEKHPEYRSFIWRRAQRLYPVFLVVLCFYLILSLLFPSASKLPQPVSKALVYIAANVLMLPGITKIQPIITVAWSLSYEWFFYLTLPLLIAAFRLRKWSSGQRVAFFLFLSSLYWGLGLLALTRNVRMVLFASGIILWELVENDVQSRLKPWMEYIVALAMVTDILAIGLAGAKRGETGVVLSHVPHFYTPTLFLTLLPFCLYTMFFNGFLNRLFSWDYLRWMGNISYSYYLIHALAIQGLRLIVNRLYPPAPHSLVFDIALLAVSMAFSIVGGAILYLFVEKPLSWSKKKARPSNGVPLRQVPQAEEVSRFGV